MKRLYKLMNVPLALVFASMVMVSAHSPAVARTTSASLPTFRWDVLAGEAQWVKTLDPAVVTDLTSGYIMDIVDANLVKQVDTNKGVKIVPDLATWKKSKNRLVYTFTIRSNAKFSNGDKVTAQDAAFSITRALNKDTKSPVATTYLNHIKGALAYNSGKAKSVSGLKVLNSRTLQITLDKPISYFVLTLSYPTADVLEKKVVNGHPANTYITNTCSANVGAGPFRFVCRNNSTDKSSFYPTGRTPTMTFEPNPNYYGKKPHIKIVAPTIADAQTAYNAYQAGQLEEGPVPSADIQKWQKSPQYIRTPISGVEYLSVNTASAPFNNVHCRLAVSYAIDRDAISNKVLHHASLPLYTVLPKGMLGGPPYYTGKDNPHFDLTKAHAELAQCPGGIHNVSVPYPHTSIDLDNEFAAIQGMLSTAGIDVKIKPITANDWLTIVGAQTLESQKVQMVYDDWFEDYPDPQDYCSLLLRTGAGYNVGQWSNKTYDKLVDQAETVQSASKRAALYKKAQHIALMDGAWITLRQRINHSLVKPYVHGFVKSYAFSGPWPKNNDWSLVSISKH